MENIEKPISTCEIKEKKKRGRKPKKKLEKNTSGRNVNNTNANKTDKDKLNTNNSLENMFNNTECNECNCIQNDVNDGGVNTDLNTDLNIDSNTKSSNETCTNPRNDLHNDNIDNKINGENIIDNCEEESNLSTQPKVVKKKRGRKPKLKPKPDVLNIQPRRRGRRPKDKFKFETTNFEDYKNNINSDENIIIKLPLSCLDNKSASIVKGSFEYNPNISEPKAYNDNVSTTINNSVQPYNYIDNNIDSNVNNIIQDNRIIDNDNVVDKSNITNEKVNLVKKSNNPAEVRQIDKILNNKYNCNNEKIEILSKLLVNNSRKCDNNILCFWCCLNFKNTAWGIPTKYENEKFDLYGVFCSPQCTLSYILNFYQNDDFMWEKIALLNLLYFKVYQTYETLVPALDKLALDKFGGSLTEDEYRDIINNNNKCYSIEFPPCNNVIPILEEIYKKSTITNSFIPIDNNRIKRANNELLLKRNKPINNNKNTLDSCMNF